MPENYIVSARKYRPPTFNLVVGQDHITTTLKNAITSNKTAQSYLFTGPRGIGKTTCARIFAKALNCENRKEDGEPCNECHSCNTFNEQRSMNIYELDAASNNSVDDIRLLNEQVRFGPQTGKYKVYIIDEVHMLSSAAFNAFLKTLEEPPSYAVFILATTEKHKIIPTILSRCQIFDFKRIQVKDIRDYLVFIAGKEKVEFEKSALHIIAQKADGALRDALSIFDRIVSFTGNNITYASVIENLNIIDYEYYFRFINFFLEKNAADTLLLFNELLQLGFDGQNLITGLSAHLRDLYVCKSARTKSLLEVAAEILPDYVEQAEKVDNSFILTALNILNRFNLSYKESKNQRLHTELCLIKICHITDALDLGKQLSDQKKNIIPEQQINKTPVPVNKKTYSEKKTEKSEPSPVKTISAENDKPATIAEEKQESYTKSSSKKSFLGMNPEKLRQQIEEEENAAGINEAGSPNNIEKTENNGTTDAVDQEVFFKAWNENLEKNLKGSLNLYNSLKSYPPAFIDDNTIEIEFKNSALENMFIREKQNIITFLHKEYQIQNLVIKTIVKAASKKEKDKYLVDPKQIYDYMAGKNPDLEYARKKLGLRFTE